MMVILKRVVRTEFDIYVCLANIYANKHYRMTRGQSQMDNPEKLENKTKTNKVKYTKIDFSLNVILFIKHNQDGFSMFYSV